MCRNRLLLLSNMASLSSTESILLASITGRCCLSAWETSCKFSRHVRQYRLVSAFCAPQFGQYIFAPSLSHRGFVTLPLRNRVQLSVIALAIVLTWLTRPANIISSFFMLLTWLANDDLGHQGSSQVKEPLRLGAFFKGRGN